MVWLDSTFLLSVALLLYAGWVNRVGPWSGRLVLLLFLSPALRYVSALFTFPIRLCLSAWAGVLLQRVGMDVKVLGNVLVSRGPGGAFVDMAVDPACMGLQLTGVSLLVGLFFVIRQEQEQRKTVPLADLLAYGLITFGLVVGCNLIRIMMLVTLNAMPGTWAHELIGLLCVGIYAWLPTWFLARGLVGRLGRSAPEPVPNSTPAGLLSWLRRPTIQRLTFRRAAVGPLTLLAVGIGIMAFTTRTRPVSVSSEQLGVITRRYGPNLRSAIGPSGFVQLSRPGLLIYVKPQTDWFSADHHPMVCWRGSGYKLRYVRITTLDGHPAIVGELRRGNQRLFTAWWYSNGHSTTVDQVRMRTALLWREENFALINVTATQLGALGRIPGL